MGYRGGKDPKGDFTLRRYHPRTYGTLHRLPHHFSSALTKQRIFKVLETAKEVYLNRKRHVGTSALNEKLLPLIEAYPPPSINDKKNEVRLFSSQDYLLTDFFLKNIVGVTTQPPVSTSENSRVPHSTLPYWRSRVVPAHH